MVRFFTAAIIYSIFVILGADISGAVTTETLGKLGAITSLPASCMAAFAAAESVYFMTPMGLPVSSSQTIVGAIIGWNLFSGSPTDSNALTKIPSTWVLCPIFPAGSSALIYTVVVRVIRGAKMHLLRTGAYSRLGLILAGAFGSYSLGANNIANVIGVFVPSNPFKDFSIIALGTFSGTQQLFMLDAFAITVEVFTYSKRVMMTVGNSLPPLSPVGAWAAVVAHSLVLFIFASQRLEAFLQDRGLPSIPLVPSLALRRWLGRY